MVNISLNTSISDKIVKRRGADSFRSTTYVAAPVAALTFAARLVYTPYRAMTLRQTFNNSRQDFDLRRNALLRGGNRSSSCFGMRASAGTFWLRLMWVSGQRHAQPAPPSAQQSLSGRICSPADKHAAEQRSATFRQAELLLAVTNRRAYLPCAAN
jgi:hypothetical protein